MNEVLNTAWFNTGVTITYLLWSILEGSALYVSFINHRLTNTRLNLTTIVWLITLIFLTSYILLGGRR